MPDYTLVYGIPVKIQGWMYYFGVKLNLSVHLNLKSWQNVVIEKRNTKNRGAFRN